MSGTCTDVPIQSQQWLLGATFCRGLLSGLIDAGTAGGAALRVLQYIALALNRGDLVSDPVLSQAQVLLFSLTDDNAELRRRVRAACRHHRINEGHLYKRLWCWTLRDLRLIEADRRRHGEKGDLANALRYVIKRFEVGLVGLDPFTRTHDGKTASLLLKTALSLGCACDHIRHYEGAANTWQSDDGHEVSMPMSVRAIKKMSDAEARQLDVGERDRTLLIRFEDAAVPSAAAVWFRLVGVDIGNAAEDYARIDNVLTVERWIPSAQRTSNASSW